MFLNEITYVCNLWPDMFRQGGCGQLDQGIVDNWNGRQRATCGVLGAVLATCWATVRYNADRVRPSKTVKVLRKVRPEEIKCAWHFTVCYLLI